MDPNIFHSFDLPEPKAVSQLAGGANNRVFKLEFLDRDPLIYKEYFQHPNDPRPRLQTEFSFLEYAWSLGLRNIPRPIRAEPAIHGALYSYLPGRFLQPAEITEALVRQKIDFFQSLNAHREKALHLPTASEACFSIRDFLQITQLRIDRVSQNPEGTPLGKEVSRFVNMTLVPAWTQLKETSCKAALHYNLSLENPISLEERCISPSDFGFHNAFFCDHELAFFDFEYAGWDDPCKMVSDLFCQPRIPIPEQYFPYVVDKLSHAFSNPEAFVSRLGIVRPLIQMRWCCIFLNRFTQVGKHRRTFSRSQEEGERQLHLAKEQFKKIQL